MAGGTGRRAQRSDATMATAAVNVAPPRMGWRLSGYSRRSVEATHLHLKSQHVIDTARRWDAVTQARQATLDLRTTLAALQQQVAESENQFWSELTRYLALRGQGETALQQATARWGAEQQSLQHQLAERKQELAGLESAWRQWIDKLQRQLERMRVAVGDQDRGLLVPAPAPLQRATDPKIGSSAR